MGTQVIPAKGDVSICRDRTAAVAPSTQPERDAIRLHSGNSAAWGKKRRLFFVSSLHPLTGKLRPICAPQGEKGLSVRNVTREIAGAVRPGLLRFLMEGA